jgi:ribosomal protein L12E/L44/L45/RPP1/RPP2
MLKVWAADQPARSKPPTPEVLERLKAQCKQLIDAKLTLAIDNCQGYGLDDLGGGAGAAPAPAPMNPTAPAPSRSPTGEGRPRSSDASRRSPKSEAGGDDLDGIPSLDEGRLSSDAPPAVSVGVAGPLKGKASRSPAGKGGRATPSEDEYEEDYEEDDFE